jgi:hypothetical protein
MAPGSCDSHVGYPFETSDPRQRQNRQGATAGTAWSQRSALRRSSLGNSAKSWLCATFLYWLVKDDTSDWALPSPAGNLNHAPPHPGTPHLGNPLKHTTRNRIKTGSVSFPIQSRFLNLSSKDSLFHQFKAHCPGWLTRNERRTVRWR